MLKGASTHTAKITDTAHGTIRSVEHVIQHLEEAVESLVRGVTEARKRLADTQAQLGAPFEYGDQLAELVRRQREIEKKLDLGKNQASSQMDAEAPSDGARKKPLKTDSGKRRKTTGFEVERSLRASLWFSARYPTTRRLRCAAPKPAFLGFPSSRKSGLVRLGRLGALWRALEIWRCRS